VSVITTDLAEEPTDLAIADFDEDGNADVAVLNASVGRIQILSGTGLGDFAPTTVVPVNLHSVALNVADMNGDGHADCAVADSNRDTVSIYLGNGHGGFDSGLVFTVGHGPQALLLVDLNGDRLPEVTAAATTGQTMTVLRNVSIANLAPLTPTPSVGPGTPTPQPPATPVPTRTRTPRGSQGNGGASSGCTVGTGRTGWGLLALGAAALVALRRTRRERHG